MVKDINKKRKKGIPHLPKHGHRTRFTEISDFRQAFLELKILFYLKEHDVVAPSHLAIEILRVSIKNSNQICKNLIKQKLIVEQHPTPKSKNYAKTEKGTKLCMVPTADGNLLNTISHITNSTLHKKNPRAGEPREAARAITTPSMYVDE